MKKHIPHQLHLTNTQAMKLLKGQGTIIPFSQMGSDKGQHIVNLAPQTARKLLTSYKKGKGMRLSLSPDEIRSTVMQGQGFKDVLKKIGHVAHKVVSHPVGKKIAHHLAETGSHAVGNLAGQYIGQEAGQHLGNVLSRASHSAIDDKSLHSGANTLANEAVHHLLGMGVRRRGRPIKGAASKTHQGEMDYTTKKGDVVHHIGGRYVKEATAPYESDEEEAVAGAGMKKGSAAMKAKMAKLRAMKKTGGKINFKKLGNQIKGGLKTAAHYVIPAATSALGTAAGAEFGPIGAVAGQAAGSYAGDQLNKVLGTGLKKRGRPRKIGGDLASMSAPYKQALRINFNGLDLNNESMANAPISQYKTNPRVKPSSTEMTLSPYQSVSSPAMNPFVPTSYVQEGGVSSGYGGRGLYGSGLYGSGLYGSGLF
jgi:hypothetical protein